MRRSRVRFPLLAVYSSCFSRAYFFAEISYIETKVASQNQKPGREEPGFSKGGNI